MFFPCTARWNVSKRAANILPGMIPSHYTSAFFPEKIPNQRISVGSTSKMLTSPISAMLTTGQME
jgi:hypothetical protein